MTEPEIPPYEPHTSREIIQALVCGFKRICPVCKKGKMFRTYFQMNDHCPNCGVKYEREPGEYIVAMYINIFATSILFIVGYLISTNYVDWSAWTQVAIWATFNALFPIWFYPRTKGLWAAMLHLGGGLYRD